MNDPLRSRDQRADLPPQRRRAHLPLAPSALAAGTGLARSPVKMWRAADAL